MVTSSISLTSPNLIHSLSIVVVISFVVLYDIKGTKGLSLFYLETLDEEGNYNNLEIQVEYYYYTRMNSVCVVLPCAHRLVSIGSEGAML